MKLNHKYLILILIIYSLFSIYLNIQYYAFYTKILNPLFWTIMIFYLLINHMHLYRYNHHQKDSLLISLFSIVLYFSLGWLFSFNISPFKHDLVIILRNFFIYIWPYLGIELVRFYIITTNGNHKYIILYITLLTISLALNYHTISIIKSDKEALFQYGLSTVLIIISNYTLLSYLAKHGISTIIPVLMAKMAYFMMPILPNLDWFTLGALGLFIPIIIYVLFSYKFPKERSFKQKEKMNINSLVILSFAFIIVCFMLGLFKYKAISILSNSMTPLFSRGDVVIYQKQNDEDYQNLSPGDIIAFRVSNKYIVHRIDEVLTSGDLPCFVTKGDDNNVVDAHIVTPEEIIGVYQFHIKYWGYPSIWLYEYLHS